MKSSPGSSGAAQYSFAAHNAFVMNHLADVVRGSPSVAVVWFVLWGWANREEGLIRGASVTRLCSVTGYAKNTVKAAIKELRRGRFISVHEHKAGFVPIYQLNAELGPKKKRVEKTTRPNH